MEVLIEVIKSEAGIDPLDPENDTNGEGKLFSSVLDWNSWKVDFNEMKVESPDVSYDNILDIKCEENEYESSYPEVKYEPELYNLDGVKEDPPLELTTESDHLSNWTLNSSSQDYTRDLEGSTFKNSIECSNVGIYLQTEQTQDDSVLADNSLVCEICNKSFTRATSLEMHRHTHSLVKPYKCSFCDKCFALPYLRRKHQSTHIEDKPFKCNLCHKSYAQWHQLHYHSSVHTEEKCSKCSTCGKCFSQRYLLRKHQLTHSNEKPFRCAICDKSFTRQYTLQQHALVHTGEKRFKCNVCEKTFTRQDHVQRHASTHSDEKAFKCSICMKEFKRPDNVKKHMLTHS